MDNLESKIEKLIDVIWRKIGQVDSKHLLMMSADLERIGNIDVKENTLLVSPKEKPSRITEYIQSAIAATAACLNNEVSPKDSEALCMEIIKDVDSLFELSHQYIFYWGLGLNEKLEDPDLCPLVLEAQEMYLVRGNRYQMFQERFFSNLLSIHNEIFLKEFDITAKDVISGIMSLEYALSQGRFQGFNRLQELYDLYLQRDSSDLESFSEEYIADIEKIKLETFSPEHYDVARITNWPEPLISQLSYEPGEAEWYEQGKYSKWPIVSLPIQSKPFIVFGNGFLDILAARFRQSGKRTADVSDFCLPEHQGLVHPLARAVELDESSMVDHPVDHRGGKLVVAQDRSPFAELDVGGEHHASLLVAC